MHDGVWCWQLPLEVDFEEGSGAFDLRKSMPWVLRFPQSAADGEVQVTGGRWAGGWGGCG